MTTYNHTQYYCNDSNGMKLRSGTTINCLKTTNLYANFMLMAEKEHFVYYNYSSVCADAYCLAEFLNLHRRRIKKEPGLVEFYYTTRNAIQDIMTILDFKIRSGIVMCGCDNPELLKKEDEERQAFMENGPGEFITIVTPEYHYDIREYSEDELCSWSVENDWKPVRSFDDDADRHKVNGGYETVCWIPHDTTHEEFECAMNKKHYSWRHNLQDVYDELRAHQLYFAEPHATEQDTIFKNMQTSILLSAYGV
jgi:hypothetical protein